MAILQKLNSKANLRKTSGGDLPYQTSYPVIARYEADSTASQTLINMTFSVDQANKESFQLFIDGKLLREGSSNDFTFTSIQADNTSSQITLNAPIDANLNIVAIKLGLRVDSLSSGSSAVSSGGSKNYFSLSNANPDFEKNVTSPWLPCTLTWSGTAPSGAPTLTATNMTLSVSNSNPLSGSYSMLLTKAPVNSQYQGLISSGLTIDREDVAKVLYGSFSYELVSSVPSTAVDFSGTSTQTYEIWIWNYDPANPSAGQWIQPAGYRGMNQSSGVGKVVFSFQTDGAFTNNAYKIAVITQQTGTGAIVVKFDDFLLGPQAIVTGTTVTDWQAYTPTGGFTTNATYSGYWRRVGDEMEITAQVATSGGVTGSFSVTIPSGYSINTSKIVTTSGRTVVGTALATQSGTNITGVVYVISTNVVGVFGTNSSSSSWTFTTPFGWGAGGYGTVNFKVPIVGWGSASQVSSDTDTRVVAARYITTSGLTGGRLQFNTMDFDTHAAVTTGSSWVYTAPVSGIYKIQAYLNVGTNNIGTNSLALYVNNVAVQTVGNSGITGFSNTTTQGAASVKLNAGDAFYLAIGGAPVAINNAWITVERLSGPSVITATETVACRYTNTAGTNITTSGVTVPFSNKDYDTHSFFVGGTGIATIPVSGKYRITSSLYTQAVNLSTTQVFTINVVKNGDTLNVLSRNDVVGNGASTGKNVMCMQTLNLNAGDTIQILAGSGVAVNLNATANYNYICIERIGN